MRMIFVMANKVYEFKFESGGPLVTTISKTINISHMDEVGSFILNLVIVILLTQVVLIVMKYPS